MAANEGPDWGKALTVGFEVAVGVGLGWVVGTFIDRKCGSAPWGLIIGILVGSVGGMYLLIKEVGRMNRD